MSCATLTAKKLDENIELCLVDSMSTTVTNDSFAEDSNGFFQAFICIFGSDKEKN